MLARGRRALAAALLAAACLPAAALAPDDAAAPAPAPKPAAPAAAPAQPAAAAWLKVCGPDQATKKETCVVSQEIRAESGQPIASVSLQPSQDPKKWGLGIVIPLGFVLPPGIGINIDGEKKAAAQYVICIPGAQKQPPACIAQAAVDENFIAALKKGKQMDMMITTPQGKTVPVEVTLAGFAKTFDGPGLDRAAAENVREQLAKGLQEKADEARKKLIDQQKKELGTE
jgi:invasion protein IalB